MTRLPLTAAQTRLWLEQRVDRTRAADRLTLAWEIQGDVDTRALRHAIEIVASRHDALRVSLDPGEPFQLVGESRLESSIEDHRLTLRLPRECCDERSLALLGEELSEAYAGRALPPAAPYRIEVLSYDESSIDAWCPPTRIAPEFVSEDFDSAAVEVRPLPAELRGDRARLLAAFRTLVRRHSGDERIVIGVPPPLDAATPFGCFEPLLPMSSDDARLQDHATIPFGRLLEILRPERVAGQHPLFEITFAPAGQRALRLGEARLTPIALAPPRARFDLELRVGESAVLTYRSAFWPRAWAREFLEQYETALRQTPTGTAGRGAWPGLRHASRLRRGFLQRAFPEVGAAENEPAEGRHEGTVGRADWPSLRHAGRVSAVENEPAENHEGGSVSQHRRLGRALVPEDALVITPHEARIRIARALRPVPLPDVRAIVFSGEPATDALVTRWRSLFPSDAPIFTMYENACAYEVATPPLRGPQPIGRPLPGVDVRVVGRDGEECAVGEIGALVIRGASTGDRARIRSDGAIELRGRTDRAVWIGGALVDPDVVERAIGTSVVVEDGVDGERRLVAYVADSSDVVARELPSLVIRTKTPAGATFVAPRDPIELQLARMWEQVLSREPIDVSDRGPIGAVDRGPVGITDRELIGVSKREPMSVIAREPIGVSDDFFACGGDSLLAVEMLARVARELGVALEPTALLPDATIEHLAHVIRHARPAESGPLITIQRGTRGRPLICVHPSGGSILCYVDLARLLGRDHPVLGLKGPDPRSNDAPPQQAHDIAARYVEAVRRTPGPYVLAGYSFGGLIAYEMAQQLGDDAALVVLLDTRFPRAYGPEDRNPVVDLGELLERFDLESADISESHEHALFRDLTDLAARYIGKRRRGLSSIQEFCRLYRLMPAADDVSYHDLRRFLRNLRANLRTLRHYTPLPGRTPIVLFTATRTVDDRESDHARNTSLWQTVAPDLEIQRIDAHHFNILAPPSVEIVAERLKELLA